MTCAASNLSCQYYFNVLLTILKYKSFFHMRSVQQAIQQVIAWCDNVILKYKSFSHIKHIHTSNSPFYCMICYCYLKIQIFSSHQICNGKYNSLTPSHAFSKNIKQNKTKPQFRLHASRPRKHLFEKHCKDWNQWSFRYSK